MIVVKHKTVEQVVSEFEQRFKHLFDMSQVQYEKIKVMYGIIQGNSSSRNEHILIVGITMYHTDLKLFRVSAIEGNKSGSDTFSELINQLEREIWVELALGEEIDDFIYNSIDPPFINLRTILRNPQWMRDKLRKSKEKENEKKNSVKTTFVDTDIIIPSLRYNAGAPIATDKDELIYKKYKY